MGPLEAALAYRFRQPELLQQALTHRSFVHEVRVQEGRVQEPRTEAGGAEGEREDNETLEFLGDAVVGLATAEAVYRRYPELSEGSLTRLRGALVSRRHLAKVAEEMGLGQHLRLGRGEERSGGRGKTALLANAMEAVIGAVYLDGGLEAARMLIEARVVEPSLSELREQMTSGGGMGDYKSALQEMVQARRQGQPEYRKTGESGPDHSKHFEVEVRAGDEVLGTGEGPTRKVAEQDAARKAIEKLRKRETARAEERG